VGLVLGPEDPAVLDLVLVLGPAPVELVLVGQGDRVELMGRVAPVVLVPPRLVGRAGRVELVLVGQGDRVELMGRVAPVVLVPPRLVGRAGRVELVLVGQGDRVELMGRVAPVVLVPPRLVGRAGPVVLVGMGPAAPVDSAAPVDPVRTGLADRVGLMGRVDPVDLAVLDLAGPVDLGDQGMDPAGLGDLGVPVGHTHPGVRTSGVAPRWAAPGMRLTASAHPTTVRRLRPDNTDSAGMVGLHPERRRRSGTDRRPRVAGAVHRLPVVGTVHGMVRRVTGASRSVISGRSITTGTTRSRCSTRYSVDGATGSSVYGSRCTDLTASLRHQATTSRLQRTSYEDERSVVFGGLHETAPRRRVAVGKNACGESPVQECAAWLCTKAGR
jgi:uncharacterized protein